MATPTHPIDIFVVTTGNLTANESMPATTDEPHGRFEVVEALGYIVLMFAAFFANIVAISTILRTKSLRQNHHNLLILNLNIIDLGITLLSMTFSVGSFFDGGSALKNSYALCRFNGLFAMTFTVGNFTTTFCIAIDRYLTVVWSTRFPPTRRRVLILLAYSWVVSLMFAIFPTAEILSKFVYTRATHHCSPAWDVCAYYIIWFVHIYGVTVPVMAVCYAFVFNTIRQKERRLQAYDLGAKKTNASSAASVSKTLENKSSEGISDSDVEVAAGKTSRKHGADEIVREAPSNVSSSGVSSQVDNQLSVNFLNELHDHVHGLSAVDLYSPVEESEDLKKKSTLGRSASLKETSACVQLNGISKDKRKRWSFRKDLRIKFTIGDGPSETDVDRGQGSGLEDTVISATEEVARLKKKKEKKRMKKLQNLSIDKQVALTGVLLVLTTVICWSPYNIIHSCFLNINLSHPVESFTMWIGYLNALLDPLIYTFMNRKARAARNEYTRDIGNALAGMRDRSADRMGRIRRRVSEGLTALRERVATVFRRDDQSEH